MSYDVNTQNLATRVATEFKLIKNYLSGSGTGDVSALQTAADNIVAAINEVKATADAASGGGMSAATYDPQSVQGDAFARSNHTGTQLSSTISDFTSAVNALVANIINDAATASGTTWSSSKINTEITAAITAALEGEDLSDLADQIVALAQADNGLVSATQAQSFTEPQKLQARNNIDVYSKAEVGDPTTNFVTTFEAGLT
ncbi:hypothetical protein MG296_10555 [Flavobacteriaceae bacterium TK19130]|nr:hypothetical protein [Thermobacterium salinum]